MSEFDDIKAAKLMVGITVHVDQATYAMIKTKAEQVKMPISRIVNFAIDNELDAPDPFHYPIALPLNEYVFGAHLSEGRKIIAYLIKAGARGIAREFLVLNRRDIGIPNRESFWEGYRELLEQKYIIECAPPKSKFNYKYPAGYRWVKLSTDVWNRQMKEQERLRQELAKKITDEGLQNDAK